MTKVEVRPFDNRKAVIQELKLVLDLVVKEELIYALGVYFSYNEEITTKKIFFNKFASL